MSIQEDRLSVRKSYLKKFKDPLSPKLLTRYYQIENKLQSAIDFELADKIPLVR